MKNIISFLLTVVCIIALPIQIFAGNLSTQKKDKILVPIRFLIHDTSEGSKVISLEYDSLLRINKIETTYFGLNDSVTQTKNMMITYDDKSLLDRSDKFNIVREVKTIMEDCASSKLYEQYFYFRTEKISSDKVSIENENAHFWTKNIVDISLGKLLQTKFYIKKEDNDTLSDSTDISYDSAGNVSKYFFNDFYSKTKLELVASSYDNKPNPFANTKTPMWFVSGYAFPLSAFSQINNLTYIELQYSANCILKAKIIYDYNDEGYPTKCTFTIIDRGEDPNYTFPDEFSYKIEYVSVHP